MKVDRQQMHRRAQKAEGRVQAALSCIDAWNNLTTVKHGGWLPKALLRDIKKQLTKEQS